MYTNQINDPTSRKPLYEYFNYVTNCEASQGVREFLILASDQPGCNPLNLLDERNYTKSLRGYLYSSFLIDMIFWCVSLGKSNLGPKTYFRGGNFTRELKVGFYISFEHFLSVTDSEVQANKFLAHARARKGPIFFKITVNDSDDYLRMKREENPLDMRYVPQPIRIDEYSAYQVESESLFLPNAQFKITSITNRIFPEFLDPESHEKIESFYYREVNLTYYDDPVPHPYRPDQRLALRSDMLPEDRYYRGVETFSKDPTPFPKFPVPE